MTSYDITQLEIDGGVASGVQTNIIFRIDSKPGLSDGASVTFGIGINGENFSNESFQLSDGQTLTIGNVQELATATQFTLASGGTVFAANSAGFGEIQGYTGGSYVSGDFTITTSGGGGGGGSGAGKSTVKLNGKTTVKLNGKITVK